MSQNAINFLEWVEKNNYKCVTYRNAPMEWTNEGYKWPPNKIYTTEELYKLFKKQTKKA